MILNQRSVGIKSSVYLLKINEMGPTPTSLMGLSSFCFSQCSLGDSATYLELRTLEMTTPKRTEMDYFSFEPAWCDRLHTVLTDDGAYQECTY